MDMCSIIDGMLAVKVTLVPLHATSVKIVLDVTEISKEDKCFFHFFAP